MGVYVYRCYGTTYEFLYFYTSLLLTSLPLIDLPIRITPFVRLSRLQLAIEDSLRTQNLHDQVGGTS